MSTKLKDIFYTDSFVKKLAQAIKQVYPAFDEAEFNRLIYSDNWADKELKAKMRHVTEAMHGVLPNNYDETLAILLAVAPQVDGFEGMIFPDYVECYGLADWDNSLAALVEFTKYSSGEFAIRPFLLANPKRGMAAMTNWAKDENYHVRRFASEGCRPRLPWAMALPVFKKDPTLILPILETLKADEQDYVRRSVANNLNDISKDHPELILDICERWQGHLAHTDWIIKHACRTLLKAGNRRAMRLFGFVDPTDMMITDLKLTSPTVTIGNDLVFSFELQLPSEAKTRLEFGIYYKKARGNLSRKVFHIKEDTYSAGTYTFEKKHSFKERTTRKHHPGEHQIAIIVNGQEKATKSFEVVR